MVTKNETRKDEEVSHFQSENLIDHDGAVAAAPDPPDDHDLSAPLAQAEACTLALLNIGQKGHARRIQVIEDLLKEQTSLQEQVSDLVQSSQTLSALVETLARQNEDLQSDLDQVRRQNHWLYQENEQLRADNGDLTENLARHEKMISAHARFLSKHHDAIVQNSSHQHLSSVARRQQAQRENTPTPNPEKELTPSSKDSPQPSEALANCSGYSDTVAPETAATGNGTAAVDKTVRAPRTYATAATKAPPNKPKQRKTSRAARAKQAEADFDAAPTESRADVGAALAKGYNPISKQSLKQVPVHRRMQPKVADYTNARLVQKIQDTQLSTIHGVQRMPISKVLKFISPLISTNSIQHAFFAANGKLVIAHKNDLDTADLRSRFTVSETLRAELSPEVVAKELSRTMALDIAAKIHSVFNPEDQPQILELARSILKRPITTAVPTAAVERL